ncbi:MAG: hypothetical protein WAM60_18865, partial [Candidatus Promineifilaceae bacterium]
MMDERTAVMEPSLLSRWGDFYAFGLFLPILLTVLFQAGSSCATQEAVTRLVESDGLVYALDVRDGQA